LRCESAWPAAVAEDASRGAARGHQLGGASDAVRDLESIGAGIPGQWAGLDDPQVMRLEDVLKADEAPAGGAGRPGGDGSGCDNGSNERQRDEDG
jgi:hypothetical protein